MTGDLFSSTNKLERIHLEDADVFYLPRLPLKQSSAVVMTSLIDQTPWRAETIVLWGKTFPQPRLIAWYGDAGKSYAYSGIQLEPLPWTDTLLSIKACVEQLADTTFNSVLLNYYRDNNDSMGMHSDDEPELGKRPVIASVSLGEERILILKHKFKKGLKPVRLKLADGSLLLMQGNTQNNWKHGINKENHKCGPRVNLTFRRINS